MELYPEAWSPHNRLCSSRPEALRLQPLEAVRRAPLDERPLDVGQIGKFIVVTTTEYE